MKPYPEALRIGISTSVIQRGKTGVAQYVFALVKALLAESAGQHDITLFALEEDVSLFDFAKGQLRIIAVPERWRSAIRNVFWHQTQLPSLAREMQLDVLHVPSYRRMLWRAPCATVATIHDLAPFHVAAKYDVARMIYGRVVARALARRQSAIVAVSNSTAKDIETYFQIPQEQQRIVLNGLDHERFNLGNIEVSRQHIEKRWAELSQPYFLYISRIEHPGKNHLGLISAFEQFKAKTGSPWKLALGGSDWHGAEVVHKAVEQSPFAKDIQFLGFVDNDTLPHLYRAAGAMVYPSLFEGFGLPPVEAMACGCPVISSTRGSLEEVIGDSALVIDPTDTSSIAKALAQISNDALLRTQLIACGLDNAQRFRWDNNAAQVLKAYHHAIEQFKASRHKTPSPSSLRTAPGGLSRTTSPLAP